MRINSHDCQEQSQGEIGLTDAENLLLVRGEGRALWWMQIIVLRLASVCMIKLLYPAV